MNANLPRADARLRLNQSRAQAPPPTQPLHISRSQGEGFNRNSAASQSTAGSVTPTAFTPGAPNFSRNIEALSQSQTTVVASDQGDLQSTDEERHPYGHTNGNDNSSIVSDSTIYNNKSSWPKQPTNVRWIVPNPAEAKEQSLTSPQALSGGTVPLISRPQFPRSQTDSPSTSQAPGFLSRQMNKDKRVSMSVYEQPQTSAPADRPIASLHSTLGDLKDHIAQQEEERKRPKKEAKIRALLDQSSNPIAVLGGMAM